MHNWQMLNVTKLHCYIVTFKCLGESVGSSQQLSRKVGNCTK